MDRRDLHVHQAYEVDETTGRIRLWVEVAPYEEEEIELPLEWSVCPTCDGNGKHVNPSIDSHGLSREDFDADPDFAKDYFRGVYDVSCSECHGRRVVPSSSDPRFEAAVAAAYQSAAEDYATRRAEGGYCY